jgi:hypothetical protein
VDFRNTTALDSHRLLAMLLRHTAPYRHDNLTVRVRYSRGADFSGTCQYANARLLINIGRHNRYPYNLHTHVARACSSATHWWREAYVLQLRNAEQLVLFIYLHELYHHLVHAAGRCTRQKEGMCDRFAARVLVDCYGCRLTDGRNRPVARETWDFQDLEAFVADAPRMPLYADNPLYAGAGNAGVTRGLVARPTRATELIASRKPR